jgi:rRNA maturation endonuclease Nob1
MMTASLRCDSCGHVFACKLEGHPIPACESCGGPTTVLRARKQAWNKGIKRS